MKIAEIYKSIQGEGLLTGVESVFVRASGCNLRCHFCDTPYASWNPEGEDLSVDDIIAQVASHACRHVVLTGGEPMLFAETIPLCQRLVASDKHVTIETAGTLYLPAPCQLMSISPKLSNSTPSADAAPHWHARHEQTRYQQSVIQRLVDEYPYQFKFVVQNLADCDEVEGYLSDLPAIDRARVMLMPEGTEPAELARTAGWLQPLCEERGLRFCPRKHIELFGLTRGT